MKKHAPLLFGVFLAGLVTFTGMRAGIIPAIIPLAAPTANRTAGATTRFAVTDNSENLPLNGSVTTGNGGVSLGAVDLKDPVNGGVFTVTTTGGASNFKGTFPAATGIIPLISGTPTPGDCANWATATTLGDVACGGGGGGGTGGGIGNVTAVTAAANTTSDQTLQELTVTAGFYNAAAQVSGIFGSGIYSIATGITPTLTWKVKLCTVSGCGSGTVVTLATFTTTATTALSSNYPWNINLTNVGTHATGATGNLIVHGFLSIDLGASAATAETVFNDANTAVSSNIDLTGALFVDFTVAASSGSTSNSFTQQYASTFLPGSNTSGGGATYTPPYINASGTLYGPVFAMTAPPQSGWTGDNLPAGSAFTFTTPGASGYLHVANFGSTGSESIEFRTAPATPYHVTGIFRSDTSGLNATTSGENLWVFGFRDGTGKIESIMIGNSSGNSPLVQVCRFTDSTHFSSCPFAPSSGIVATNVFHDPAIIQISDDGANITYAYSLDGTHFVTIYSESRTAFFGSGPTQVQFGGEAHIGPIEIALLSWLVS